MCGLNSAFYTRLEDHVGLRWFRAVLIEPGVSLPTLAHLDARIQEVTERRDRAQLGLDSHLQAAERLLAQRGESPCGLAARIGRLDTARVCGIQISQIW